MYITYTFTSMLHGPYTHVDARFSVASISTAVEGRKGPRHRHGQLTSRPILSGQSCAKSVSRCLEYPPEDLKNVPIKRRCL